MFVFVCFRVSAPEVTPSLHPPGDTSGTNVLAETGRGGGEPFVLLVFHFIVLYIFLIGKTIFMYVVIFKTMPVKLVEIQVSEGQRVLCFILSPLCVGIFAQMGNHFRVLFRENPFVKI